MVGLRVCRMCVVRVRVSRPTGDGKEEQVSRQRGVCARPPHKEERGTDRTTVW